MIPFCGSTNNFCRFGKYFICSQCHLIQLRKEKITSKKVQVLNNFKTAIDNSQRMSVLDCFNEMDFGKIRMGGIFCFF